MNRDEVLATLPSNDEFNAAPDHDKQSIVVTLIRTILDELNDEPREPDRWEADHLAQALGNLSFDWFNASICAAELSLTPSDERTGSESWVRRGDTPTSRALREGLDYLAVKPVRNR